MGDRRLTARYLVGADGAVSTVARSLGLRRGRRLGGALEAEVPLDGHEALHTAYGHRAVFSLGAISWGYAWVFPKGEHLSVGIGRFRPGRADLRAALRQEMARLGIPLEGVELHGHPLPLLPGAALALLARPAPGGPEHAAVRARGRRGGPGGPAARRGHSLRHPQRAPGRRWPSLATT